MRRPRVVLFEDGADGNSPLKRFFDAKGCETRLVASADICPFYSKAAPGASGRMICCDIEVIVHRGPVRDAARAIEPPFHLGCTMRPRHRAVVAGMFPEELRQAVRASGAEAFSAPLDLAVFGEWINGCMQEIENDVPPIAARKEERRPCIPAAVVSYRLHPGDAVSEATALNLSFSGICVRTRQELKVRQVVHLWSEKLLLAEDAEVRWSHRDGDGTQIAGLTFSML